MFTSDRHTKVRTAVAPVVGNRQKVRLQSARQHIHSRFRTHFADRLDRLIHTYEELESSLALAIANDDYELIEQLNAQHKNVQSEIISFKCQSSLKRRQMFEFLMRGFIETEGILSGLPEGMTKQFRQLSK